MRQAPRVSATLITALAVIITAAGCGNGSTNAGAKSDYPVKPISIAVESSPGSPVDVMARQIGKLGQQYLGTSVVVETKSGGGSALQLQYLKSKPADGYALGTATRSLITSFDTTLKQQYTPSDFVFVCQLELDPYVIAVNADSNIKSLKDLVSVAKSNPQYSLGGFGGASAFSLLTRQFAKQAGFTPNYVPFDGGSAAVTAALGNQVNAVVTNISNVVQQVKANKLRVLAVTTAAPVPSLPGVPTFQALGYKDMVLSHWRGIYAKAGTPQSVIDTLDAGFKKMLDDPGFQQYLTDSGLQPGFLDSAAFEKEVKADLQSVAQQLK